MAIHLSFPEGGALITGGTGSVGEGIVRKLAEADVPLVFTYRANAEAAKALEAELTTSGHRVAAVPMDMSDTESIGRAARQVVDRYGRLHTVACGSGVPLPFNRIADFTIEEVEKFILSDALGYYRIFHTVIPLLRQGGGSFTTCSTIANRRVIAYDGLSPLSKGSVEALVRQAAAEEAMYGVRCNAVAIGWVIRETLDQIRELLPPTAPVAPGNQEERLAALLYQLIDIMPMRRPGTLDEAGSLFAFLASDQASFITGQAIALDGGATL